jgi:hypothetical protein
MRYFALDAAPLTLANMEAELKAADPAYAIRLDLWDTLGDLFYGETRLAQIEINHADDDIFQDDVAEFLDTVGDDPSPEAARVRDTLQNAAAIIALECFWEGTDSEATLARLDPLVDWLFAHAPGLFQADGEGFYDANSLILERKFTL